MADKKESSEVAAAGPAMQKVDRAPQHACMEKLKTEAYRLKEAGQVKREKLEKVGSLPQRASVGYRPRGLLAGWLIVSVY